MILEYMYDSQNKAWKFRLEQEMTDVECEEISLALQERLLVRVAWGKSLSGFSYFYIEPHLGMWLGEYLDATLAKTLALKINCESFDLLRHIVGEDPKTRSYRRVNGRYRMTKVHSRSQSTAKVA